MTTRVSLSDNDFLLGQDSGVVPGVGVPGHLGHRPPQHPQRHLQLHLQHTARPLAHLGQLPDVVKAARAHAGLDVPLGGEEPRPGVLGLQAHPGGEGPLRVHGAAHQGGPRLE